MGWIRPVFRKGWKTEVFARMSTVASNQGSPDLPGDVRGFAVKFHTSEGNRDLVGNNIPVFFIQHAIKFPHLIRAGEQAPARGFPQAQTAHDNFRDIISLTREAMPLLKKAGIADDIDDGCVDLTGAGIDAFVSMLGALRHWDRESTVHAV